METKKILVPFVAILTLLLVGFVAAEDLATDLTTEFNSVILDADSTVMAGFVGDTVPVRVSFIADTDEEDVRIKARIEGHRDDVYASTSRFDIIEGSTYTKLLNVRLPSDLDDLDKEFTLYVEVVSADSETRETYTVRMQRESYTLNILSLDYNTQVSSGDVVPVSVVVENTGFQRADDNFVVVSIPELGVSSKAYMGDLIQTEYCDDGCEDEEDSMQKTLYVKIPENAKSGVYDVKARVFNKDSETQASSLISVGESDSTMVLATMKNQDIEVGETKTYDLILVNSGEDLEIFRINSVSSDLIVSAPSVVTVGPESSNTVEVSVTAPEGIEVGSYTFSLDVNGEQVLFGANVEEGDDLIDDSSASVVALTVVLVIIFVVLLIVLIVLLTRKEKPSEEVETSYY